MRQLVWVLSGLLLLTASAPSRADFTMRLGGSSVTDVPFQTLVDEGDATVDPTRWGVRIAVGGVRVAVGTGVAVGVGAYRVAVGPPYWGYYRPLYYPRYAYWGYRPYYWNYYRPYYSGGYYSSYYYPSYSYYNPSYYGCSGAPVVGSNYYAAPPNVYQQSAPMMPPAAPEGDGTYPYDGGPRAVPYPAPQQQPAPSNTSPPKTIPREGRVVLLTASSPAPAYPAYGADNSLVARRVEPAPSAATTRLVSVPARAHYPAFGETGSARTLTVRADSE